MPYSSNHMRMKYLFHETREAFYHQIVMLLPSSVLHRFFLDLYNQAARNAHTL